MSILSQIWPFLLAAGGAIIAYISRLQVKNAKQDAMAAKATAQAHEQKAKQQQKIIDAIAEGEQQAKIIKDEAQKPGSVSDLRKSGY